MTTWLAMVFSNAVFNACRIWRYFRLPIKIMRAISTAARDCISANCIAWCICSEKEAHMQLNRHILNSPSANLHSKSSAGRVRQERDSAGSWCLQRIRHGCYLTKVGGSQSRRLWTLNQASVTTSVSRRRRCDDRESEPQSPNRKLNS